MTSRPPILKLADYSLDSHQLWVLQKAVWLAVPLAGIARVKHPSLASAVVQLADGRRLDLDLSHLGSKAFSVVTGALRQAARGHRAAHGARRKRGAPPPARAW